MVVSIKPKPGVPLKELWNWLLKQDIGFKCVGVDVVEADVPEKYMDHLRSVAEVKTKT